MKTYLYQWKNVLYFPHFEQQFFNSFIIMLKICCQILVSKLKGIFLYLSLKINPNACLCFHFFRSPLLISPKNVSKNQFIWTNSLTVQFPNQFIFNLWLHRISFQMMYLKQRHLMARYKSNASISNLFKQKEYEEAISATIFRLKFEYSTQSCFRWIIA